MNNKVKISAFTATALLSFNAKAVAFVPFLLWGGLMATAGFFGWNSFTATEPASDGSNLAVAAKIFAEFHRTLMWWFEKFYTELSAALIDPLQGLLALVLVFIGLSFYFGKFGDKAMKLIKLSAKTIVVVTILSDYSLFKEWVLTPMFDFQTSIIEMLLDTPESVKGFSDESVRVATSLFSGVNVYFDQIFTEIQNYGDKIKAATGLLDFFWTKQLSLILIGLVFMFLYAIFSIMIFLGYFGFFVLMSFAPIMLIVALFKPAVVHEWFKNCLNYFLIPVFTAIVMSITMTFLVTVIKSIGKLQAADSVFTQDLAMALFIGVMSIGLHWKAGEFAARVVGGMAADAGSIVGTAAATGAVAYGLAKTSTQGAGNFMRGTAGFGTENSQVARAGASVSEGVNRFRKKMSGA